MILNAMRGAAPSAEDIAGAYQAARQQMAKRRERYADRYVDRNARHLEKAARELEKVTREIDLSSGAKAAKAASWKLRRDLAGKLYPRARRRGGFGVLALGLALGAAVGYMLADRRNRERVAGYAQTVTARAKPVVTDVVAKVRNGSIRQEAEEAAIQTEVQTLLAAEKNASGLRAAVEGRTVYLRGEAPPEVARDVAERIRQLPGVAAVVNLAMSSGPVPPRSPDQAPAPTTRS